MDRRSFLKAALALPLLPGSAGAQAAPGLSRVRPGQPGWPSAASWDGLDRDVGGRLIRLQSPLGVCQDQPSGAACREIFKELKNPYFIGDDPCLTQTTGWVDAWTSQPSVYAVAARRTEDVVAAVNFARENNLRLVVKGGGHSYLGTSNAPDSLLIWTRAMSDIVLHDAFVAQGCTGQQSPQPAVSVGAGAIWMHTYNEVTTKGGRYIQGGGCGTVGVAGLVQGGGFGSYSKTYGTAAASLLEAEIVTADGVVRIANACTNPDLFWALKGGGGGTFGAVTRVTLRTHELPAFFGGVAATIQAASDAAFRRLLDRFVAFYAESLFNPHWGEIANVRPHNRLDIQMAAHGLERQQIEAIWQPFLGWVKAAPDDFSFNTAPLFRSIPARHRWDPTFLKTYAPAAVRSDDRPGAPEDNIFWAANVSEAGHFIHDFESAWLPASLLRDDRRAELIDALLAAARHSTVELHFQKGLAGGTEESIASARNTATNPAVIDAFALAIIASEGPPAYPGLRGHEPDLGDARRNAREVAAAMVALRKVTPQAGSYVAESSYFETDWQNAYWGANYPRLLAVKGKYDPAGLFFVHHGVGSEAWSADGFTRLAAR
jgi:FAD binding domain/Berberine and berberine like